MITKRISAIKAVLAAILAVPVLFFFLTSVVLAAPAPSQCQISVLPNNASAGSTVTLAWTSDSTLFGEVTNDLTGKVIGSSPDGLRVITVTTPATYTLRAWNSAGETVTCSTALSVSGVAPSTGGPVSNGNPTVAVVTTQVPGYVTLSDIPYTGLEDNITTLLTLMLTLVSIVTIGYLGREELAQSLSTFRG